MNSEYGKIVFLGGDRRMDAAKRYVASRGYNCVEWGIIRENEDDKSPRIRENLAELVRDARAVILPIPISDDGVRLRCHTAPDEKPPRIKNVLDVIARDPSTVVFGGRIDDMIAGYAGNLGLDLIDYSRDEDLQIRNAVPTAEAAVLLALRMMDVTVRGSRCAVVGYGRIGRYLAGLLRDMGANVTVAARKSADLTAAELSGMTGMRITEDDVRHGLDGLTKGYDLIVNTVPVRLIDKELIGLMPKTICVVDVASAPGGVDMQAAKDAGIRAEWGLSLPGRFFPESAGTIIGKCIVDTLGNKFDTAERSD